MTVTSWPIFRLIDRIVRSGASTYWLRAALPTSKLPCGSSPTTDGKIGVAVGFEDDRAAIADDRYLAVGCSQVDSDDRLRIHILDSWFWCLRPLLV